MALEQQFRVFLVEYEAGRGFFGAAFKDGKRSTPVMSLDDLMRPVATMKHTPFHVAASVKDANRQREAIWGFLFSHHGKNIAANVLLPRILINCGIQPWFKYVWNLDRIFIVDGIPWLFEVKHKFPFWDLPSKALAFGLNDGEVGIFRQLAECGIGSLFSIMVKPKWSKSVSPLYMINNLNARGKVAVLSKVLDKNTLERLSMKSSGTSGEDTTISGAKGSQLKYKPLFVSEFGLIGQFSDEPSAVANRIVDEMRGRPAQRATDEQLNQLRMPE